MKVTPPVHLRICLVVRKAKRHRLLWWFLFFAVVAWFGRDGTR